MNRMNIELFGRDCELISYDQDGESMLVMDFGREVDGYLAIGCITARIKGKSCTVDTRRLNDGEYTPHLILPDRTVDLPRIKKDRGFLTPMELEGDYLKKLSVRERRLAERVDELERRLDEISERVMGKALFGDVP